jgi:hypothetical protein
MIILRQKNNSKRDDIIANYINKCGVNGGNGGTIIPRKWSANGKERSKNRQTGTIVLPKFEEPKEKASFLNRLFKKEKSFTYEEDDLEAYEELDPKKIAKLTDNQKRMLLEDERAKAKRNKSRVVSKYGKEGERKGRIEGKKKGTKRGAIAGGIIGGIGGAVIGKGNSINSGKDTTKDTIIGGAIGVGAGAGIGALMGRAAGAESGAAEGKARGEAKGRRIAKEQGHDDIDRTTRNVRALDDYARTHKGKGKDDWEVSMRNQLKKERKDREEAEKEFIDYNQDEYSRSSKDDDDR